MKDLTEGMVLPGVVTNVAAFGAFVDVGVHQDGLVHISELSDNFVKDPMDFVKVGQKVKVTVVNIDMDRQRIGLSMKSKPEIGKQRDRGPRRPAVDSSPAPRHEWQEKLSGWAKK
jgi:uncharacterized protein